MLVTEKEAATKWCPHVRFTPDTRGDLWPNRKRDDWLYCLGSRCMAWRWADQEPADADVGYCGLAGGPNGND